MASSSRMLSPCLIDTDIAARIALAAAGVAGDASVAIAIDAAGGAPQFVAAVHDGEDRALPLSNLTRQRIRGLATGSRVARILDATHRGDLTVMTPNHVDWPTQVEVFGRAAPLVLWVAGSPAVLPKPGIALTGTSAPTRYGIHMALELGTGLAQRGWVIAAGAGAGIDHHSLRAAIAMGGHGIAVAAADIDRVHVPDGVTVVSEVPPTGQVTLRTQRRAKHLLAALAVKTIVVEAGLSSGALRTAEAAHALGRPVGVVPGDVTNPASSGCHELAQRHGVQLVTSIRDADRLR